MTKPILTLCALLVAASASAQTVSHTLRIYNSGATQPIATLALADSGFQCGQAPTPSGVFANPAHLEFDDPAGAGKVCRYTDPGSGPLLSLPATPALYEATLTNGLGGFESPESARAPFARLTAPVNVRVVK